MFSHRFKITWDQSVANFSEQLPWQLIGILIALGTCFAVWLIYTLGNCLLGKPITKNWTRQQETYKKLTRKCGRSAGRLFFIVLAIAVGIVGFWIACTTAGVSFIGVVLSYGILSLVLTYTFGAPLQNLGAYFVIALTDKVSEDWYLNVAGVQGRVVGIYIFWIELEYYDGQQVMKIAQVPTVIFISSIVERLFTKEDEYLKKYPVELNPHTKLPAVGLRSPAPLFSVGTL